MKPTPKQQQAIDFDEGKCLVAAGAGSGKTKVLTSRVFNIVASGKAKLSELLVLTFTNKAAHEMKMRVRDLFASDPAYCHLVSEVETSKIMTFDAFALDLVKRYRYELGLDKGIDLLDACFFEIKTEELLDEVLNERYEAALSGEDKLFTSIVAKLSPYGDDELKQYVKALLALADKKIDRDGYLDGGALAQFNRPYIEGVLNQIEEKVRRDLRTYYEKMSLLDTDGLLTKDFAFIDAMLESPDFDSLGEFFTKRFPQGRGLDEETKEARKEARAIYIDSNKQYFSQTKEAWINDYLSTRPYVEACLGIANEVSKRLNRWKKEKGVYGFADIALLAKQIVSGEYGEKVKGEFRYVMIDEYQDTSDLQEDFVEKMGVPNIFLVGDIKQSIYGFRNANPKLFSDKFDRYGSGKDGTLITLDDNFRSREQVLDSINDTFSSIMSEEVGGIDYAKGQALHFGNHGYDTTKNAAPYGYEVISYRRSEFKKDEHVALILARDILHKIATHYQVKSEEGTRDIRFGDFAILTRKTITLKRYEKVFRSLNIPVSVATDSNAFDEDVMITLANLMQWLALYENDTVDPVSVIHFAVALKRSFLFAKDDRTIFLEAKTEANLDPLVQRVYAFYLAHKEDTLPDLVEAAMVEFDFVGALLRLGEVKANFDLLQYFVGLSRSASHLGMGLSEFASFLKKRKDLDVELSVSLTPEDEGSVKMMTIHKSKGLEFPFVYFPALNNQFQNFKNDGGADFISSLHYGPVMPIFSRPGGKNLLSILAKEESKREAKSEEMRLLYVALTRPKESYAVLIPQIEEGVVKAPSSFEKCRSDLAFLSFSSFFDRPIVDGETLPYAPVQSENALEQKEVRLSSPAENQEKEEQSEPKSLFLGAAPYGALRYGKKLHRYMEVVDLSTKDLSFIANLSERQKIANVLALPIFDMKDKQAFREFEYIDHDGSNKRIDLFFLCADHIEVIDYKSSSLDDPDYQKQVREYMSHLKEVYSLPVEGYLLSLSEARLIKVE